MLDRAAQRLRFRVSDYAVTEGRLLNRTVCAQLRVVTRLMCDWIKQLGHGKAIRQPFELR